MTPDLPAILTCLRAELPAATLAHLRNPGPSGQDSLLVAPEHLVAVCQFLHDTAELDFDLLSNVTGVDWPEPAKADAVAVPAEGTAPVACGFLEVVYHLYSTSHRVGPLVLRARTVDRVEQVHIPSVVAVYRSAEYQEREIFDLYGVKFAGHPDLRRILMWDEFLDHPMRKDYVAPDDYQYEPTPHDAVLEKTQQYYTAKS